MLREEVIYEKKFPKMEVPTDEELEQFGTETDTDEEAEKLTFEQIIAKIYKDVVCVFMPERVEGAKEFIRKAIEVSDTYEMDIKVEKRTSHISVTYYFNFGASMKYLTDVIGMADDIAFFGRKDKAYDIVMSLDFYTHTVCRKGRQIHP